MMSFILIVCHLEENYSKVGNLYLESYFEILKCKLFLNSVYSALKIRKKEKICILNLRIHS